MGQVLLQSATAFFITKCDGLLLQSATAFLLQSLTILLQSATGITKCDDYYKVRQYMLQSKLNVLGRARYLGSHQTCGRVCAIAMLLNGELLRLTILKTGLCTKRLRNRINGEVKSTKASYHAGAFIQSKATHVKPGN